MDEHARTMAEMIEEDARQFDEIAAQCDNFAREARTKQAVWSAAARFFRSLAAERKTLLQKEPAAGGQVT